MSIIDNLERLLAQGKDDALLRFGLGNAYLQQDQPEPAIPHLRRATEHDRNYSAAWKLLGKALHQAGRPGEAIEALDQGIAIADERGDVQAAKEMGVFKRRAAKGLG